LEEISNKKIDEINTNFGVESEATALNTVAAMKMKNWIILCKVLHHYNITYMSGKQCF
jgi:hypothetical protein